MIPPMPKRSSSGRKPRDVNVLARSVMERIEKIAEDNPGKDPLAVALGRRGGLKGGPARMASMNADERRKLATKAAKARWRK